MQDLISVLQIHARERPEQIAFAWVSDDGRQITENITFSQLWQFATQIANLLVQHKLVGSPVILLFPPDDLSFVRAFYGCLRAGAIAVPVCPPDLQRMNRTMPRFEAVVNDCGASVVLTTRYITSLFERKEIRESLSPEIQKLQFIAINDIGTSNGSDQPQNSEMPKNPMTSIAYLQYTSGSTGTPKGVMVTGNSLAYNCLAIARYVRSTIGTSFLSWTPLYHDTGLVGFVCQCVMSGSISHLMSPLAFMKDPSSWLRALSLTRAEITASPNFGYVLCTNKVTDPEIEGVDLQSLRLSVNGAEPVRAQSMIDFYQRFKTHGLQPGVVVPVYGLAEATLMVSGERTRWTSNVVDDHFNLLSPEGSDQKFISCGRSIFTNDAETDIIIVNPETRYCVADGGVGEIWISGPTVTAGYWNKPEITEEIFHAKLSGEDKPSHQYLRTGDCGFIRDRRIYIAGRLKDMIICRGVNYYPQDIEAIVETDHSIKPGSTASFSVTGTMDEELVIVTELKKTSQEDPLKITKKIKTIVADHIGLNPAVVVLIEEGSAHKTSSGKIQRKATAEAYMKGQLHIIYMLNKDIAQPKTSIDEVSPQKDNSSHPLTSQEQMMAQIWSRATGIPQDQISRNTNFFEIGGDSLMASIVALSLNTSVQNVLARPIFSDAVINLINCDQKCLPIQTSFDQIKPTPIDQENHHTIYGVSGEQEQMLILAQSNGWIPYTTKLVLVVQPSIPIDQFKSAVISLVEKHQILRTSYRFSREDKETSFKQVVHGLHEPWAWARCVGKIVRAQGDDQEMINQACQLCDISELNPLSGKAPVIFSIISSTNRNSDMNRSIICLAAHHICYDGRSLMPLVASLSEQLINQSSSDETERTKQTLQYHDYSEWQRQWIKDNPIAQEQRNFWIHELTRDNPQQHLTFYKTRETKCLAINSYASGGVLSKETANGLVQLCTQIGGGCTKFTILLMAYAITLSKLCRQREIVIGVPHHGRSHRELEALVGYFIKMLTIRIHVETTETVTTLLKRVRDTLITCSNHADIPLTDIKRAISGHESANFETVMTYQSFESKVKVLGQSRVTHVYGERDLAQFGLVEQNSPKFEIACHLSDGETGEIKIEFEFNRASFDPETINCVIATFRCLVESLSSIRDRKPIGQLTISDIRVMSSDEEQQLLQTWSGINMMDHCQSTSQSNTQLLHQPFEQLVQSDPDLTAIEMIDDKEMRSEKTSYDQLNRWALGISRRLIESGVKTGHVVGLMTNHDAEAIAGALGILKSGAGYMPLSSTDPVNRLTNNLRKAGCHVLLVSTKLLSGLQKILISSDNLTIVGIPSSSLSVLGEKMSPSTLNHRSSPNLDDPAVVICTSGSTGTPKVVSLPHFCVSTFVHNYAKNNYGRGCRSLLVSPMLFDASVMDIFCALSIGGTVIMTNSHLADLSAIHQTIVNESVTHTFLTTSVASRLCHQYHLPKTLEFLSVGGEEMTHDIALTLRQACDPQTTIINGYGPTETVIFATNYNLRGIEDLSEGQPIPIGRPLSTHTVYVLDESEHLVPIGFPGELYIGGPCCHGQYLGDSLDTTKRFIDCSSIEGTPRLYRTGDIVRWLPSHNLVFMGRNDQQVKLRGHRIDLSEIESVVRGISDVLDVVALIHSDELVCYLLPKEQMFDHRSSQELIQRVIMECQKSLAEYMIPQRVLVSKQWPQTKSGKVDRQAFPDPSHQPITPTSCNPQTPPPIRDIMTPIQKCVANSFAELFNLDHNEMHLDTNFYELGGNSLQAFDLVLLLERRGLKVSHRAIFASRTIREIAEQCVQSCPQPTTQPGVKNVNVIRSEMDQMGGIFDLSPFQQWYFNLDPSGHQHLCQAVALTLPNQYTGDQIHDAFETVAKAHPTLRHRFVRTTDGWKQKIWEVCSPQIMISTEQDLDDIGQLIANINIVKGPLVGVSLLSTSSQTKMIMVIHHLIVDGVSWKVIIHGLIAALHNQTQIEERDSFRKWITQHTQISSPVGRPNQILSEMPTYVQSIRAELVQRLPFPKISDQEIFDALLHYASNLHQSLFGSCFVDVEGHGREGHLDLSSTVGWFTTIQTKRCLCQSHKCDETSQVVTPQICLNFHGDISMVAGFDGRSHIDVYDHQVLVDPQFPRIHPIDLNVWIADNQLHVVVWVANTCPVQNPQTIGEEVISTIMGKRVDTSYGSQDPPVLRDIERPVTKNQEHLLTAMETHPKGREAYDLTICYEIRNPLFTKDQLVIACTALIMRHDALRTSFHRSTQSSHLYNQRIYDVSQVGVNGVIVSDLENDNFSPNEEALKKCVRCLTRSDEIDSAAKFAIGSTPTGRLSLAFSASHAVVDANSLVIITQELEMLVRVVNSDHLTNPLKALEKTFGQSRAPTVDQIIEADHRRLDWVNSQSFEAQTAKTFWHQMFSNEINEVSLVGSTPQNRNGQSGMIDINLNQPIYSGIIQLAKECSCTPFNLLLSAYALVLLEATTNEHVIIGTPFQGRTEPEEEKAIGYLIDVLPIKIEKPTTTPIRTYVSQISQVMTQCIVNARVPLENRCGEGIYGESLYRAFFSFYDHGRVLPKLNLLADSVHLVKANDGLEGTTKSDLSLDLVSQGQSLTGSFVYDCGVISKDLATALVSAFIEIVTSLSQSDPNSSIDQITFTSDEESLKQDHLLSHASSAWDVQIVGRLDDDFNCIAKESPDSLCAIMGTETWTYGQVSRLADEITTQIRSESPINSIIAVCCTQHPVYLPMVIGVLRVGSAFFPIRPGLPTERVHVMMQTSQCRTVLVDTRSEQWVRSTFPGETTIIVVADRHDISIPVKAESSQKIKDFTNQSSSSSSPTAYILATSGTTGIPKLVAISHTSAKTEIHHWSQIHFHPEIRVLFGAYISFDQSIQDTFCTIKQKGVLVFPECNLADSHELIQTLETHKVEHAFMTPTMLAECCTQGRFPKCVRQLDCAGESLSRAIVTKYQSLLEGIDLIDSYGPTETTVTATAGLAFNGASHHPVCQSIGQPLPSHSVFVLGRQMQHLPKGFPGELYIGGPCVALGYLNPEETTRRFVDYKPAYGRVYRTGDRVRWLEDNTLQFLGRVDTQIKLRGQRIELQEIEAIASQCQSVVSAIAVVVKDNIVCFVSPQSSVTDVSELCHANLPQFMIPNQIIGIDQMPRSVNGKIDRCRLIQMALTTRNESQLIRPLTPMEMTLATIWSQILNVDESTIHADTRFTELGGHSIKMIMAIRQANRKFHCQPSMTAILGCDTLAEMASLYMREQNALQLSGENNISALSNHVSHNHIICVPGPMQMLWTQLRQTVSQSLHGFEVTTISYPEQIKTAQEAVDIVVSTCQKIMDQGCRNLIIIGFCRGCIIAQTAILSLEKLLSTQQRPALVLVSPDADDDNSEITMTQCALGFTMYCAGASGHFSQSISKTISLLGLNNFSAKSESKSLETYLVDHMNEFEILFSDDSRQWLHFFRTASGFSDETHDHELEMIFQRYYQLMQILTEIQIPRQKYTGKSLIIAPHHRDLQRIRDAYPGFEIRIVKEYNHWQLPDHFIEIMPDFLQEII